MKERIKNTIQRIRERIKNGLSDLYGPDEFAAMEDGMGTVEVILIIVEKTLAENTYVLCGN